MCTRRSPAVRRPKSVCLVRAIASTHMTGRPMAGSSSTRSSLGGRARRPICGFCRSLIARRDPTWLRSSSRLRDRSRPTGGGWPTHPTSPGRTKSTLQASRSSAAACASRQGAVYNRVGAEMGRNCSTSRRSRK
jgi:hypothetical protein